MTIVCSKTDWGMRWLRWYFFMFDCWVLAIGISMVQALDMTSEYQCQFESLEVPLELLDRPRLRQDDYSIFLNSESASLQTAEQQTFQALTWFQDRRWPIPENFNIFFPWLNMFNIVQSCSILFNQNSAELEWMSLTLLHLSSKHQSQHIAARMGSECSREQLEAFRANSRSGWRSCVINSERLSMGHHIKDSHVAWPARDGCQHCIHYPFGLFVLHDCVSLWSSMEIMLACSGTIHHNTMHPPKPAQQEDMIGRHSLRRHCKV